MSTRKRDDRDRDQKDPTADNVKILCKKIIIDLCEEMPQTLLTLDNQYNARNSNQQQKKRDDTDNDTPCLL
jgi:hypothetical protein